VDAAGPLQCLLITSVFKTIPDFFIGVMKIFGLVVLLWSTNRSRGHCALPVVWRTFFAWWYNYIDQSGDWLLQVGPAEVSMARDFFSRPERLNRRWCF
jgi:hypothetical protein